MFSFFCPTLVSKYISDLWKRLFFISYIDMINIYNKFCTKAKLH